MMKVPRRRIFYSVSSLFKEVYVFVKKDFNLKAYLYTVLFIAAFIFVNYHFSIYKKYVSHSYYTGKSVWVFPVFYLCIYLAAAIPNLILRKRYDILKDYRFYLKGTFFVVLYGVGTGYFGYRHWEMPEFSYMEKIFVLNMVSQLKCFFIFMIPLILMKFTIDKKVDGFYGLAKNTAHFDGYFALFLLLLPFVILVSFTPDFLHAYPQFHNWSYRIVFGMNRWWLTTVYETAYSIDFVMTELLFRGTLVLGMALLMGRCAVLPMVAFYVSIHFGKPMIECMSSALGGYILGALAYQTRHIWGGVMVHIFIALSMETMGFLHHYILK